MGGVKIRVRKSDVLKRLRARQTITDRIIASRWMQAMGWITVDDVIADWSKEKQATERRERRTRWVEAVLSTAARACVLETDRPWSRTPFMLPGLPADHPQPTGRQLQTLGGVRAVLSRVARGGLDAERCMGLWTPGFLFGLRMSGALRREGNAWSIWVRTHQELLSDMEAMPMPHRLEPKAGRNGVRRLRRCPAMLFPPSDPQGAEVVAGLFAGAVLREGQQGQWLELPATSEVMSLLEDWTVLCSRQRLFRGQPMVGVSPFFGALFAHMMPPRAMERVLNAKRPAMCPLLPALYWEWAFCRRGQRMLPSNDALPFACSRRTCFRRGWSRKDSRLHRQAIEAGICHVDPRLRELMVRWFEEHRPDPPQKPHTIGHVPPCAELRVVGAGSGRIGARAGSWPVVAGLGGDMRTPIRNP